MKYKPIAKHLNKLLKGDKKHQLLEIDLEDNSKYVFFSDHHRGLGDTADDFKNSNMVIYSEALDQYHKDGFSLVLLGDVEELEQNPNIDNVLEYNKIILSKEETFNGNDSRQLLRIFGNHDDKWEKKENVTKYLNKYHPNLKVHEGVLFRRGMKKILCVHGHQGAWGSDRSAWTERIFLPVERFFRNLVGSRRKVEYEDLCLVGKREQYLYRWTSEQSKMIMISGHTHRPVWGGLRDEDRLRTKIEEEKARLESECFNNSITVSDAVANPPTPEIRDTVRDLSVHIHDFNQAVAKNGMCNAEEQKLPIFYNTGCCMYADGSVTGIEIEEETMRLVKWKSTTSHGILKEILEEDNLDNIFSQL